MTRRKTLLFDLDGTLVDSAKPITSALNSLIKQRGGEPSSEEKVRHLVSLGAPALVREGLGLSALNSERDLAAFREILANVPTDPAWAFPSVYATLMELSSRGYKMAIVTNKPETLSRLLLEDLGLLRFFRGVVGGDTLKYSKPRPEPLYYALELAGGSPSSALMIGDSSVDATAARAASIPFVLFEGGYGAPQCLPAEVFKRFTNFAQLLDLIAWCESEDPVVAAVCDQGGHK